MWRAARKKNSEKTSPSCSGWWNMRRASCPGVRGVETVRHHAKDCMARSLHTSLCHSGGRGAGETNILRTVEQNESQTQVRSVAGSEKLQCRELRGDGRKCIQSARSQEDRTARRWDKEAINNVIGVPWRLVDGKWTVDRPVTQVDPLPPPPVPFEGARVQRERITRTDIEAFGTTAGRLDCNAIRSGKRAQAHSDCCRARIEECLKTTQEGAERLDRKSEVLNEALA